MNELTYKIMCLSSDINYTTKLIFIIILFTEFIFKVVYEMIKDNMKKRKENKMYWEKLFYEKLEKSVDNEL